MLPPDLFALFVAPLNALGVTYMVTGGVAAIIYGEPRLTTDIDLVVVLSDADVPRVHAAFEHPDIYVPPVEVMAVEAGRRQFGHFNLIHSPTGLRADVYVAGTDTLRQWALTKRRSISLDGEIFWLAPPEYVILSKLQYLRDGGSPKHITDIQTMRRILGTHLDLELLRAHVRKFGLQAQWDAVGMP